MEEKGELLIKSFENNREVHIEFSSKAQGVKNRQTDTLFMPFAEGTQSFSLPLCYRLLKDMGGFLTYSQDSGDNTVTVSLPMIAGPNSDRKNT